MLRSSGNALPLHNGDQDLEMADFHSFKLCLLRQKYTLYLWLGRTKVARRHRRAGGTPASA